MKQKLQDTDFWTLKEYRISIAQLIRTGAPSIAYKPVWEEAIKRLRRSGWDERLAQSTLIEIQVEEKSK